MHLVCAALESIGKTRFATIYWAAQSVERNLRAMYEWTDRHVSEKKSKLDKDGTGVLDILSKRQRTSLELGLTKLICLSSPFAKSIQNLEGRMVNAADIFLHWIAIQSAIKKMIEEDNAQSNPDNRYFPVDEAAKIVEITNKRYNEMINDAPTDIYLVAFFLDPSKSLILHPVTCPVLHTHLVFQNTDKLLFSRTSL